MWSQTYGGTSEEGMAANHDVHLVRTSDGIFALAGGTYSFGAGGVDFWLVKTDANGNMEWNRTYGGADIDRANSVVQTSDGGYAVAGETLSFGAGEWDSWLIKTDANGNMEWNKTYGGTNGDNAVSLVETADGGFAMAGDTTSFGAGTINFWLVKTDDLGNIEWNQTYGESDRNRVFSMIQTSDGGFALAGDLHSHDAGVKNFWLVKTDENGDMAWNQIYGGADVDTAFSLVETSDGGYALAGETKSSPAGDFDFWLVKTNGSGNMEWNRTYGGPNYDFANSVIQTSDGGYAVAGNTLSFGSGSYDFWLVKTDAQGIPEFPLWTLMLLLLIVLTVAIAIYKRRLLKTPIQ